MIREDFKMKKIIIAFMAILMIATTVSVAERPIESTTCYATAESTVIAEKRDVLDEVKGGLGYE